MKAPRLSSGARRAVLLAAFGAVATALPAQSPLIWQWCERAPVTPPSARAFAGFAAGPMTGNNEQIAVLFGGSDANGLAHNDTWEWDGASWWHNPNGTPGPAVTHTAIALDPNALVGVRFGGLDSAGTPTDLTWLYEFPPSRQFREFQQQFPAVVPPARADHAMSPSGSGILMFGGAGASGALADTWTYDHRGRTWVQLSPAQSPPARSGHRMAYDAARGRVVMFGGRAANGTLLADTWEWDGATWSMVQPATSPPPRADHAMAGAVVSGQTRVVMHGGEGGGGLLNDGWAFDGVDWQPVISITSLARSGHSLVEMGFGTQPTTFGGNSNGPTSSDSTWTLEGYLPPNSPVSALICTVAPGCGSLPLLPRITTDDAPIQDPFQPTSMTYELVDLPMATLPANGLGAFVWGLVGGPVPCNPAFPPLQSDVQYVQPFAYSADATQVGYTIPTTPNLTGATLYHQAVAILPTANLAWVTSNLIRVRIGQ